MCIKLNARNPTHIWAILGPTEQSLWDTRKGGWEEQEDSRESDQRGAHESAKQKSAQKYFGVKRKYANDASDNQEERTCNQHE